MRHVLLSDPGHTRSQRTPPVDIPQETRRVLLEVARAALATATGRADLSTFEGALERSAGADEPAAVFVTLTEDGDLRGCIGTLDARRPLYRAVAATAISAALDDPRFAPVSADELPAIHVEISVLGPFHELVDQDAFRPGIDGLVVEFRRSRRAAAPGGGDGLVLACPGDVHRRVPQSGPAVGCVA